MHFAAHPPKHIAMFVQVDAALKKFIFVIHRNVYWQQTHLVLVDRQKDWVVVWKLKKAGGKKEEVWHWSAVAQPDLIKLLKPVYVTVGKDVFRCDFQ